MSGQTSPMLPPVAVTEAAVAGGGSFPVRRIYCVGRNYLDHIREMKEADERDPPFFFQKPRDSIVLDGAHVPYPPFTSNFQFEVELVVALGKGGRDITVEAANSLIWGYAVGIDFTRRDRQFDARDMRLPWEVGKSFDASAPCGPIAQVKRSRAFQGLCDYAFGQRRRAPARQHRPDDLERSGSDRAIVEAGSARSRRSHLYGHAFGRRPRRAGRCNISPYRRIAAAYSHHHAT